MRYTVEYIRHKIATDQAWMERAVIAIYNKQTSGEKQMRRTVHKNYVGFSAPDAKFFSYVATWILGRRHLTGKFKRRAFMRIPKYAGQLTKIANGEV
jgi:hypothetical protein